MAARVAHSFSAKHAKTIQKVVQREEGRVLSTTASSCCTPQSVMKEERCMEESGHETADSQVEGHGHPKKLVNVSAGQTSYIPEEAQQAIHDSYVRSSILKVK